MATDNIEPYFVIENNERVYNGRENMQGSKICNFLDP